MSSPRSWALFNLKTWKLKYHCKTSCTSGFSLCFLTFRYAIVFFFLITHIWKICSYCLPQAWTPCTSWSRCASKSPMICETAKNKEKQDPWYHMQIWLNQVNHAKLNFPMEQQINTFSILFAVLFKINCIIPSKH